MEAAVFGRPEMVEASGEFASMTYLLLRTLKVQH